MTHRKSEHPSVKKCRYFLNNQCKFSTTTCWYSHQENNESGKTVHPLNFTCNECEQTFSERNELMKHKKLVHLHKYFQNNQQSKSPSRAFEKKHQK